MTFDERTHLLHSPVHEGDVFALVTAVPDTMAKADAGERWITLHPHGKDGGKSEGGVHVKIHVGPDGSGHVISGPGALRGLRLTRLASPEELAERRRQRDAERSEKKRQDEAEAARKAEADLKAAAENPEEAHRQAQAALAEKQAKATHEQRVTDLEERAARLREALLDHAAQLTGDAEYQGDRAQATIDPASLAEYKARKKAEAMNHYTNLTGVEEDSVPEEDARAIRGAGSVIASRNVRQIMGGLTALRQHVVRSLIADDELRAAVLGEGDAVDPASLERNKPSGNPGYRRASGAQARAQGFTPAHAKKEADDVFKDRISQIAAENPKKAEVLVKMRESTLARVAMEGNLKSPDPTTDTSLNTPAPTREVSAPQIRERAEQVRAFLKTHDELKALEKELRATRLAQDPDATPEEKQALDEADRLPPPGAEQGDVSQVDAAFAARLDAEVRDAEKQDLTRAFLDSIEADPEHSGYASDVIRKAMTAHIGVGAHAHLANVALSALGHEGLDRQVVDTLGVEGAAQVLAHAIRRDASPEDLNAIRAALAQHHDETSLTAMRDAMEAASAARADAAEIDLPPITNATDAAAAMQLQKERKARISEAHEALGTALGQVEAGAALNLALGGAGGSSIVRFGNVPTAQVATALRALGLQDGDYVLARSPGQDATLAAQISPAGLDRLSRPLDAERQAQAQAMARIKSGAEDEPTYLPAGFEARPPSAFNANPALPPTFALPLDLTNGLESGVDDMIASRYADGWEPSEIYAHLRDNVAPTLTPAQSDALFAHLRTTLPITRDVQRVDASGTAYVAQEAQDVDRLPEVRDRLQGMARAHVQARHPGASTFHDTHLPDNENTREAVFRTLAANPALAAAFSPPSDLGGDHEGRVRARAIKRYAEKHLLHAAPAAPTLSDEQRASLAKIDAQYGVTDGEGPEKWQSGGGGGFDLFGGGGAAAGGPVTLKLYSPVHASEQRLGGAYTPEQRATDAREGRAAQERALAAYGLKPGRDYALSADGREATLTDTGKQALTLPPSPPTYGDGAGAPDIVQGGLDGLNPEWAKWQRARNVVLENARAEHEAARPAASTWPEFVTAMGGSRRAYAAVQEHMRGDFMRAFHEHYGSVTGQALKVGKARTQHGERLLALTNPARLARMRAERARTVAKVRARTGGRFGAEGEGSAAERADAYERDAAAAKLQLGSLFTADEVAGHAPAQADTPRALDVQDDERHTLGHAAEARLGQMVRSTPLGIQPGDSPVGLIKGLGWGGGTRFVGAQRGVKALLATGRLLGFYGAGSGKTGMQIGGFTEAHAQGKARKALLVCPSIVRNQFGEEAARFTTPGQYSWHARDDSYEGRKKALTGDTHMVVVTHATFRDDMIRLMSEHQGVSETEWGSRFERMDRPARAAALRDALAHHGIPLDYLAIDEAHDFLNRSGKQDSLMSKVAEAAMDNAKFKSLWTGSPVKNDPSEIHDWLSKVDPGRFGDRDTFLRRYGVNTQASREALQRLMDSYSYVDSVRPNIQRTVTWGARDAQGNAAPLALTPQQQQAYQDVLSAFQRASRARREGRVDVDAARTLSPRSFEGADESQHETIARGLQGALGTLKHAALGRVVNEFPAEHNAKVQHVLKLVQERAGKGGVIFARNRESVATLRSELERAGLRVGVIDGSTTTEGKGQVRNAFDRGDVDLVIASDAGATGANLQKRGEYLINYDLPLTYKTMEQRNARIDRLGQSRAIELHHLQTDTPYDTDNVRRLHRKRELGEILQGEFRSLDDQGLSGYILRARAEGRGDGLESWDEPLTPPMDENARPPAARPDVPDQLPAAPGTTPPTPAPSLRA